jgi:hypothetical protein
VLQPKIDLEKADEFELEPPLEVSAEMDLFLDDAPGAPAQAKENAPQKPKAAPSPAKSSLPSAEDLILAEDPKEAPKAPEPTVPCPACGEGMKEGAILCIHCGLDLRTGEKLEGAGNKKGALGKLFGGLRRDK